LLQLGSRNNNEFRYGECQHYANTLGHSCKFTSEYSGRLSVGINIIPNLSSLPNASDRILERQSKSRRNFLGKSPKRRARGEF
jgi:hypothetical protein